MMSRKSNILYYLENLSLLDHLVYHKRRDLRLKDMKYFLTQNGINWKDPDGVILTCIKDETDKLIKELHSSYCSNHFVSCTTVHKILRVGYYWTTLFTDTHFYVRSCQPCQFFSRKQRLFSLPFETNHC